MLIARIVFAFYTGDNEIPIIHTEPAFSGFTFCGKDFPGTTIGDFDHVRDGDAWIPLDGFNDNILPISCHAGLARSIVGRPRSNKIFA